MQNVVDYMYGSFIFKLKDILKDKNISIYALCKLVDTDYNVINRYIKGDLCKIDLEILSRLCYYLDCDITDIIEFKKTKLRVKQFC